MAETRDGWSKLQIVASVLTPVLIFAFGTLISLQQNKANDAQREADRIASEAQKSADRVTNLVKSLNSDKRDEKIIAIMLLRREKQKHPDAVPDELMASVVPAMVEIAKNDPDPEVSNGAKEFISETALKTDTTLGDSIRNNVENVTARVYLHIRDERQRGPAKQLENILVEHSLSVPSIEKVDVGPSTSQVRFFRPEDETEAGKIVELLRNSNLPDVQARLVGGSRMRAGHFEVWVSPGALNSR